MFTFSSYKRNYINFDIKNLTLRFRLKGKGAALVNRQTFFSAVEKTGITDVLGFWKAEDPYECFASLGSKESADYLIGLGIVPVNNEVEAYVTSEDDVVEEIKFMWVPLYVSDELFEEFLGLSGFKILSSKLIKDQVDGKPNGTRVFKVIGNKAKMRSLPHLVDFSSYGFQSLVKVPGRDPLCLKCKGFGHLRFNCPQGRREMPQQVIIDPTKSVWGLAHSKKVPEQEDAASKCSDSDNEEQRRSLDDSVKSGDDSIGNISLSSSNEDNVSNKENIVNDQSDKNTTINKADKKKDDDTKNAETDKPKDENISQSQTDKGEDDDDFIFCTNPDNLKRKDEKAIKTRKSNVASGFGRQRTQRQK